MLWLGILLTLLGTFIAGLGWGGNGSKKDYVLVVGFILFIIPGLFMIFKYGGVIIGIVSLFVTAGLTREFAASFARKYGTRL